jgi:hypothetical protein
MSHAEKDCSKLARSVRSSAWSGKSRSNVIPERQQLFDVPHPIAKEGPR